MKAQIDQYKGWYIYEEVDTSGRFAQVVTWTAEKDGSRVTLQADTVKTLKELIEQREAQHE